MNNTMNLSYVRLALAFGPASKLAVRLLEAVGSPEELCGGKLKEVRPSERLSEKEIEKAKDALKKCPVSEAERMAERCAAMGIEMITPDSPAYPAALSYLDDRPLTLYLRGTMPDCNFNMTTAVVGTRKMTDYGRNMAYSIGAGLAYGGSIVVSGMALGADSMALIGALEAGGTVIAVFGSGVDVIYPKEHRDIYRKILENGAVISEYPPGTPPIGSHFPVRNRIMSGIADAAVVVEADSRSGSLITASHARDQGKKIFAVPGKIGEPGAEGPNALIRDGALTALCAEDILAEFEFIYPHSVSVARAHSMLHGKNIDELSRLAMERTRINARDPAGSLSVPNYYGQGTFGGRRTAPAEKPETAPVREPPVPLEPPVPQEPAAKTSVHPAEEKPETRPERHTVPKPISAVKSFFGLERDEKTEKSPKKRGKSDEKVIPAKKIELDMLDESEIKIYNKMKPSVPTLPDELVDAETPIGEIMGALTMLEMAGAVESGNGGYFTRIQPDDIMQSENS